MPGAKKLIVIVLEEIDKTNSQTLDKQSPHLGNIFIITAKMSQFKKQTEKIRTLGLKNTWQKRFETLCYLRS